MEDVKEIIPYGDEFLFVDRIISLDDNKIIAEKEIKDTDYFLKGHFVDFPIMPGTLVIEGIGQAGTILVRKNIENHKEKDILAYKVNDFTFKKPVFPNDKLRFEVNLKYLDGKFAIMDGKVANNKNEIVGIGMFTLAIVNKEEFRK
tara:strand:+ start:14066 stop:14503 length:438 start_codon:yes stop_codon:yes gene_type:complete